MKPTVYCLLGHLYFTFHSPGATVGWVLGQWQCCLGTFYSLPVVQPAWLKNESDTYKERVICKSKTQCLDFLRILMFFLLNFDLSQKGKEEKSFTSSFK